MVNKIGRRIRELSTAIATHWMAFLVAIFFTSATMANPVLNNVAAGNATVSQTVNTTTINQTSQKAILNWRSFNIGSNELTHFNQPTNGIALNRISAAQGASQIYGRLTATGKIILINPAGVYFGPGSFVNVGGIIATTANISDSNFLNNYYNFDQASSFANAEITNAGQIIAADNGLVALVGGNVTNSGHIQANLGHVVLASGDTFTMSLDQGNLIHFAVDSANVNPRVTNSGSLTADGGTILVTARTASNAIDGVINMGGVAQANSVSQARDGSIILGGDGFNGTIHLSGKVKAKGKKAGTRGGKVRVTGKRIEVASTALIDVTGDVGGGSILIGGNYMGLGPMPHADSVYMAPGATLLANAISSGSGGQVVLWSDYKTQAHGHIEARGGEYSGDGGLVETSSKNELSVAGATVDTRAPKGQTGEWLLDPTDVAINNFATMNGGFNGGYPNKFTPTAAPSNVNVTDVENALLFTNVTIQTASAGAQAGDINVNTSLNLPNTNKLTLKAANDINFASGFLLSGPAGANLSLISDADNSGVGTINGLNGPAAISLGGGSRVDLFYNPATFGTQDPGRFSSVTATTINQYMIANNAAELQNINLFLSGSFGLTQDISGAGFTTPIGSAGTPFTGKFHGNDKMVTNLAIVGGSNTGLFGVSSGTIQNVGVSGTVTGGISTGGILGNNLVGGIVTNAYNYATVTGGNNTGGVVGNSFGTLTQLSNYGTVNSTTEITGGVVGYNRVSASQLFNSGAVNGTIRLGGITGINSGSLSDSYNTGTVTTTGSGSTVGGLVGENIGFLTRNYSAGIVTGPGLLGGLVGNQLFPTGSTNNYYDSTSSGQATATAAGAATGITAGCFSGGACLAGSANLSSAATFTGWNITETVNLGVIPPGTVWFNFAGQTRPMLMMEYQTDISTPHGVQLMGAALDNKYGLASNVDFTAAMNNVGEVWNTNQTLVTGSGFHPIAFGSTFTGSLDGNNNSITGFYINRPTTDNVAMFSATSAAANISDFSIGGTLTANQNIAGLVATNAGTIDDVHTSIDVISSNNTFPNATRAGGLVATNSGTITNSSNTGDLTITGNNFFVVGGLVGQNLASGTITNSFSEGTIIASQVAFGGGFVGRNFGSISTSYATVKMLTEPGSPLHTGTFVGYNQLGATISDSYSLGYTTGQYNNGGFVGTNAGTIDRAYHSGAMIQDTSGAALFGGFVGVNEATGIINDSFWDTNTTGQATGFGANTGALTNLTPGCFTGVGCLAGTANMSNQTTYTSGGPTWNFAGTWGINNGSTYPYLTAFYAAGTPRGISGTSAGATGNTIQLANAGAIHDTTYRAADGSFYFLVGNNLVSGVDKTIADGTQFLTYIDDGSAEANAVANMVATGITTLDMATANLVNFHPTATASSNAILDVVIGTLPDINDDILFDVNASPNLTLKSGASLTTNAATTYSVDGNMTATNGNITMNGPVSVTAPSPTIRTNTTGDINIAGNLNGNNNALTINTIGAASTISGIISNLTGLTKIGAGTLTLSNTNTYTGTTSVNAGTLATSNVQGLGPALSSTTTVLTGGVLAINGVAINEAITLTGGTITSTVAGSTTSGPITLTAATINTMNSNAGVFNVASTIDGNSSGLLTLQGPGSFNITGNIGTTTAVGSLTSNSTTTLPAIVTTTGSQAYNGITTLGANATLTGSNVTFGNTLDGAQTLGITATGTTTFTGAVGGTTPLTSLTVAATGGTNINGGAVTTIGNQTYGSSVALGADALLTMNGAGPNTLTINGGVSGGNSLSMIGSMAGAVNNFIVNGPLTVNNFSATAPAGSGSSLTLNTGLAQTFTVTGVDTGSIVNAGIAGTGSFTNIANLTGGTAADGFVFSGGTLAGNIDGAGGSDTVTGDNIANTFNITGADTGTVTSLGGTWSDVENLIGGTNTNNFVFNDGASLSGLLDGGPFTPGDPPKNTIDTTAYTPNVTTTLVGNTFDGTFAVTGGGVFTTFTRINNLLAKFSNNNTLGVPMTFNAMTLTGPKAGDLNVETFFNGYDIFTTPAPGFNTVFFAPGTNPDVDYGNNTVTMSGIIMYFTNFALSGSATNVNGIVNNGFPNDYTFDQPYFYPDTSGFNLDLFGFDGADFIDGVDITRCYKQGSAQPIANCFIVSESDS